MMSPVLGLCRALFHVGRRRHRKFAADTTFLEMQGVNMRCLKTCLLLLALLILFSLSLKSQTEIYPVQTCSRKMPQESFSRPQPQYWTNLWTHGWIFIKYWAGVWQPHRKSAVPLSTSTGLKTVSHKSFSQGRSRRAIFFKLLRKWDYSRTSPLLNCC